MPNKTSAKEWLVISYHDMEAAKLLFEANHYTDSIANLLQQSIEKSLKSLLAYENRKIIKSHKLVEIYSLVTHMIELDDKLDYLELATEYYVEDRYPNPNYELPPRDEIEQVISFAEELFDRVCKKLDIDKDEIVNEK